jgi:hypothetical protein
VTQSQHSYRAIATFAKIIVPEIPWGGPHALHYAAMIAFCDEHCTAAKLRVAIEA